jgi:putative transposase
MTERLVIDAFLQRIGKEQPGSGLIVQTDQGSQSTGANFMEVGKEKGAIPSHSRKGNPYDNALMESFYRTLKRELVDNAGFRTRDQARQDIFKYIELYYNSKRKHFALGYMAPRQFEEKNS